MGEGIKPRLIKRGMKGDDVIALQGLLAAAGYGELCGAADGIFGKRTLAAVTAFQQDNGLQADGIAGPLTLAALNEKCKKQVETETEAERRDDRLARFLAYLEAQVGQLYVWGASGQEMTLSRIHAMEDSARNVQRATALYERRRAEGLSPLKGYDCSGLISRFMQDEGLVRSKRNSRHLYDMSEKLFRLELMPGDLVFRHNGIRIFHVGVYIGEGLVIEAKGRDDGVVKREIDASGTNYWNRFGRIVALSEETK